MTRRRWQQKTWAQRHQGWQAALKARFGINLNPGQVYKHKPGLGLVLETPAVVVATPPTAGVPVPAPAPQLPVHPLLILDPAHADVQIVEVRDMGANVAHIDARIGDNGPIITAGCGVDQIMDRPVDERLPWLRQVVWDYHNTEKANTPHVPKVLDIHS